MNEEIAGLVRRLVAALCAVDGVVPKPGARMMVEWQATGSAEIELAAPGRVSIATSSFSATVEEAKP